MNPKSISDDELLDRQIAIKYARASVELEGFKLSAAQTELDQRFANGDLSLDQYLAAPIVLEDGTVITREPTKT